VNPHLATPSTNKDYAGLQTPRLKRLAEIVSAQAIAQQEKLEYPAEDGEYDDDDEQQQQHNHHLAGVDEAPEPVEASA
jgi:myosin V